jgi:hypothetical protein
MEIKARLEDPRNYRQQSPATWWFIVAQLGILYCTAKLFYTSKKYWHKVQQLCKHFNTDGINVIRP